MSFNGNKIITTGAGGAVLTKNKNYYNFIKKIGNVSRVKHNYEMSYNQVGYNYKMANINAALGYSQFKKLIKLKKMIENQMSSQYIQALNGISKKEIFDQLEKNHSINLPQNLVDNEINLMTKNLKKFGLVSVSRTGAVAMTKGDEVFTQ